MNAITTSTFLPKEDTKSLQQPSINHNGNHHGRCIGRGGAKPDEVMEVNVIEHLEVLGQLHGWRKEIIQLMLGFEHHLHPSSGRLMNLSPVGHGPRSMVLSDPRFQRPAALQPPSW